MVDWASAEPKKLFVQGVQEPYTSLYHMKQVRYIVAGNGKVILTFHTKEDLLAKIGNPAIYPNLFAECAANRELTKKIRRAFTPELRETYKQVP